MRKNSLLNFNKPDFLVMAASLAVIVYSGIFYMSNLLFIGIAVAAGVVIYILLFKRGFKKLGMSLVVIGIALVFSLPANWLWFNWQRRGAAAEFEQKIEEVAPLNKAVLDEWANVADAEKMKQLAMAFQEQIETGQTIARIEIPKIGVNSIIVEGTEESELMKGPGHVVETPIPGMQGNFSVAGDRVLYGAPFLNLDDVAVGDEIIVETTYGKFAYEVFETYKVTPDDISVLESDGTEMITLITCDPPWGVSNRLIVKARVTKMALP